MRLLKKQGQSVIEYSLIVMTIAASVVIMGPYIVRSVNAQLKMWEESVNDSVTENIVDSEAAPSEAFPLPNL